MTTPRSSQAVQSVESLFNTGNCHTNFKQRIPHRFLSDISNGATVSRASSCANRNNTPVRGSASLLDTRNDKRRTLSKVHGDLSNIRPKSPPLYSLSAALGRLQIDSHSTQGLRLSHDRYVDDSHNVCSERDLREPLGSSCAQDVPVFRSSLAAQSKQWSTSELGFEPTKRGSHQVC